jgi:two-component system, cell cycle response regulator
MIQFTSSCQKELLDQIYDGVCMYDAEKRITYWNAGMERITGYKESAMLGQTAHDSLLNYVGDNGTNVCANGCVLDKVLQDGAGREMETFVHHMGGHCVPVVARLVALTDDSGKIIGVAEILSNNAILLSNRARRRPPDNAQLLDPLTGIGNQLHLQAKIKSALAEFEHDAVRFGLLLVDIDQFEQFNTQHGDAAGDRVLKMVANTLRSNLRGSDSCGRLDGSDSFMMLLYDVDERGMQVVAQKLNTLIQKASVLLDDGTNLQSTACTSGTLVQTGDTHDSLLERLNTRMGQIKSTGHNQIAVD